MKERLRLLGLSALFVIGCSVTKVHRVVTGTPGAPHTGPVLVVMHGSTPPPYEEIAIVQAVGQAGHADLEHVVAGMKEEAQRLGCTGLINVKVDQGAGQASGTAVCVRILAAAPAVPPPAPTPPPPPVVSAPIPPVTPVAPVSSDDAGAPAVAEPAPTG